MYRVNDRQSRRIARKEHRRNKRAFARQFSTVDKQADRTLAKLGMIKVPLTDVSIIPFRVYIHMLIAIACRMYYTLFRKR